MDIITHSLAAYLVKKAKNEATKPLNVSFSLFTGALIPDVGEIIIQAALAKKFGEKLAVYDDRTSDLDTASQINVTWLYDILHSFVLPIFLMMCAFFLVKNIKLKNCIYYFSVGLFTHILLDCFTHGKVWALKLFYPLSNYRFKILEETVGNWWDWTPKFKIPFFTFELPIYCPIIWTGMAAISIFFILKNKKYD